MNTGNDILSVDIIASDPRCYDMLRLAVGQLQGENLCEMATGRMADVLLLDFAENTESAWTTYRKHHPDCLTIVLAAEPSCIDMLYRKNADAKLIYLPKPINREALVDTLHRVHLGVHAPLLHKVDESADESADKPATVDRQAADPPEKRHFIREKWDEDPQHDAEICGARDDIDLTDQAQLTNIQLPVTGLLLGNLLAILKKNSHWDSPFNIRIHADLWLCLHPQAHWIEISCPEQTIREISRISLGEDSLALQADTRAPNRQQSQVTRMALELFLWKLALWTYRGQLPEGIEPGQRVYLQHWPNLTRLLPIPNAMRIAALWSQQTLALGFTATALKIPQRHVFAFYGAAHTIGLAGQARRGADILFEQNAPAHHRQHSLLQRVALQMADSTLY